MKEEPPVWTVPVTNYDGRPVAQSGSLNISGLCIIPAGGLATWGPASTASDQDYVSHLTVAVDWRSNPGGKSLKVSKVKGTFMLYGPLDMASSIVEAVANEADGEMRVLREQSVRVSLLDQQGRNRVGGEDADLFFLDFFAGPSTQPQVCHPAFSLSLSLFSHTLALARAIQCWRAAARTTSQPVRMALTLDTRHIHAYTHDNNNNKQ